MPKIVAGTDANSRRVFQKKTQHVNWFLLALGTALFTAVSALLSKRALLYWSEPLLLLISSSLLAVLLFSLADGFQVAPEFFIYLPISVGLHIGASLLNLRALKSGELSEVFPLINLTPLFMFATSPIIGGEFPRLITIPGILLIVLGAYLLQVKRGVRGILTPLKALWHSVGARCMIGVAFLWSIAGNFDKLGVLNSSPEVWGASVKTGVALFMIPACMIRYRRDRTNQVPKLEPRGRWAYGIMLILPLLMAANIICNMKAYELTLAINVVSVKRLCSLFSVLLGWYFLRESQMRERMTAAAIMVIGVLWVGFA